MKYITFPRTDRVNPWFIGKNTWKRMSDPTRDKFRAYRDKQKPCKLRVDIESPTLGDL